MLKVNTRTRAGVRLGIRTIQEMDQAEYNALEDAQERYLDVVTDKTVFAAQFIRDMHRDWLGGIYEWAGSYRTVEISKGGFPDPHSKHPGDWNADPESRLKTERRCPRGGIVREAWLYPFQIELPK